jgi:small subunit ribosomal protein S5
MEQNLIEKLIKVNRVTKVVKGGRIMAFVTLVVVGDGKGNIGIGKGKSKEVPLAVQKAVKEAVANMISIPLVKGGTILHPVYYKYGATKVMIKPAKEGHGVIAGGAMRQVFEALGIHNITAKVHGSTNAYNVVKATLHALQTLQSRESIMAKRGISTDVAAA